MNTAIHPKMFTATVTCACGVTFETLSTKEVIKTEICSKCHPFYTGEQKFVDTAQRVEKFQAKAAASAAKQQTLKHTSKKAKNAKRSSASSATIKADTKAALKAAKAALADL